MANTSSDNFEEFKAVKATRRFLFGAQALSHAFEETLVDLVSAYTPWLAPLIPAAIGFENVQTGLGFNPFLAFVYAAVIEFLGLATVTTALEFRAWNIEQSGKRAPLWAAILTAAFYLTITLAVNVVLDAGTTTEKIVKGLASTFSVVGAITLALRSEQAKRVAELQATEAQVRNDQHEADERTERLAREAEEREYQRRAADEERRLKHELKVLKLQNVAQANLQKVAETPLKLAGKVSEGSNDFPDTYGKWQRWPDVPDEHKRSIAEFIQQAKVVNISTWKKETARDIVTRFGVDERVAYNWIGYAERDFLKLKIGPIEEIENLPDSELEKLSGGA
jgi:hypothetical protein